MTLPGAEGREGAVETGGRRGPGAPWPGLRVESVQQGAALPSFRKQEAPTQRVISNR